MNTRIPAILLSLTAAFAVSVPQTRACDPPTKAEIKDAEKAFDKMADAELKLLKKNLKAEYKLFCEQLEAFKKELKKGIFKSPVEAFFYARIIVAYCLLGFDDMVDQHVLGLADEGTTMVKGLGVVPRDMQAGGGGTWDHFIKDAIKANEKYRAKMRKKLKEFAKLLGKVFPPPANPCPPGPFGPAFVFMIPFAPDPVAAAPGVPPLIIPHVPFRLTSYAAGRIDDHSQIDLIGKADPGSTIQVKITGPGGFTQTQNVTTGPNGQWSVDFKNLPPGQNYGVTATNGNTSLAKTVLTN